MAFISYICKFPQLIMQNKLYFYLKNRNGNQYKDNI